jgi:hypothetical protein
VRCWATPLARIPVNDFPRLKDYTGEVITTAHATYASSPVWRGIGHGLMKLPSLPASHTVAGGL